MSLEVNSPDTRLNKRETRLPNGTRRRIRRLKQAGDLKEAVAVRTAALDLKNSTK